MALRRTITLCFLLAVGLPVVFSVLSGCESTPSEPVYDNPFDPEGPTGGDPLQVRVVVNNETSKVSVSWNQPQDMGIATYDVWTSNERNSGYSPLAEGIAHTTAERQTWEYTSPEPTKLLWYRVRAIDLYGNFSFIGYSQPDSSLTGPRVIAGDGSGKSATRFIDLKMVVTNGENIRLADNAEFSGDTVLTAAPPNDTLVFNYDLGAAARNDTIIPIFAKAFTGGVESAVSELSVRVDFRPAFTVVGDPKTVATRLVDLAIPASGVQSMRFALDADALESAPWLPGADLLPGFELSDSANEQTILGEFAGDFGFNSLQTLAVTPDLLTAATFRLDLPADHVTDQAQIRCVSRATATLMRFSESPDLSSLPWQAYADTAVIVLSPGEGRKVIYAQYRNDWADSPIYTDYAIFVSQPAEVFFIAPRDGDVVLGGVSLQVRGTALAGSEVDSIMGVKFDPGDGAGFRDVTGTTDWTYPWSVARYDADTVVNLRARAYVSISLADTTVVDSVTSVISVTVTQLSVAIDNPADAAAVAGGATIKISGSASGILGGAPVDSVTVDVGDEHFLANGAATWDVDWTTPRSVTQLDVPIVATVWSGGETASDAIAVTVDAMPIIITAPADGAEIPGGAGVAITGRTSAAVNGAPVDSVRVEIGDEVIPATGTTAWAATWLSPVVAENTPRKIFATVFAGEASATDSLTITLVP
jgi:hypothetical protein